MIFIHFVSCFILGKTTAYTATGLIGVCSRGRHPFYVRSGKLLFSLQRIRTNESNFFSKNLYLISKQCLSITTLLHVF